MNFLRSRRSHGLPNQNSISSSNNGIFHSASNSSNNNDSRSTRNVTNEMSKDNIFELSYYPQKQSSVMSGSPTGVQRRPHPQLRPTTTWSTATTATVCSYGHQLCCPPPVCSSFTVRRRLRRGLVTILIAYIVFIYYIFIKYKPHRGKRMDHYLSYIVMYRYFRQQHHELIVSGSASARRPIGMDTEDPMTPLPMTTIHFENQINTHLTLRTLWIQRQHRAQILQQIDRAVANNPCWNRSSNNSGSVLNRHTPCSTTIPSVVFVPSFHHHHWDDISYIVRPHLLKYYNTTIIRYNEIEMDQLVQAVATILQYPLLMQVYDQHFPPSMFHHQKIYIWSICVVYYYGGIFMNGNYMNSPMFQQDQKEGQPNYQLWLRNQFTNFVTNIHRDHLPLPLITMVVDPNKEQHIHFIGSKVPRHPMIRCFLFQVIHEMNQQWNNGTISSSIPMLLLQPPDAITETATKLSNVAQWHQWNYSSSRGNTIHPTPDACSNVVTTVLTTGLVPIQKYEHSKYVAMQDGYSMYIQWIQHFHHTSVKEKYEPNTAVVVDIREQLYDNNPVNSNPTKNKRNITAHDRHSKVTLQSYMRQHFGNIEPNWFCSRCLHWAMMGTYRNCDRVCSIHYIDLMCTNDHNRKRDVTIDLLVRNVNEPSLVDSSIASERRTAKIPRIIHQTWYADVTFDQYPQLARLQASWKSYQGWEYRFYSDQTARQYIATYFPPRFVESYDALIHGAYKADLFRYLVLLREGGVYVDIDVMLQGSLDSLITSSLSFFVPRDIPCEYAGQAYCLWNGLIGSSPGNPIIVRAVERLINYIEDRADMYDMERGTCEQFQSPNANRSTFHDMEVWKLRAQPLLFLSGPCGLGVAFNEAVQRDPLTSIPLGWMSIDNVERGDSAVDYGDALILIGDKYDLGEFRISHPETGMIIAATDILSDFDQSFRPKIQVLPIVQQTQLLRHQQPAPQHYSKSMSDNVIWGTTNVYHDDLVRLEKIRFNVTFLN